MKPSLFSLILQSSTLLFAVLGPRFFHSEHGQATMNEIETALLAANGVDAAVDTSKDAQSAPKPA